MSAFRQLGPLWRKAPLGRDAHIPNLAGLGAPSRAGATGKSKKAGGSVLRGGAQVHEHYLRNGMQVLMLERHSDPVVAALMFYRVGSRDESDRESGISHFLEHMMFKGSKRFGKGEVDRLTAELGGHNNAFTSNDHTAYWFELAADRWEMALEIEADRMCNLKLHPLEFEAEKAVVLDELSMGEDDPWRVLARRVQALIFKRHAYRNPIIGYADTLRNMTADDMHRFYRKWYRPQNATLVLSGDFQPGAALKKVRKHFGSIEGGPPVPRSARFADLLEEPCGEARINMRWDDPATRICMAWPSGPVCSDDDYTLDVVSTILTSGRLARLQRKLVLDGGLASMISASNDTRVDAGLFWFFAECAHGVDVGLVEAAIDQELQRLIEEPVSKAELNRARSMLTASEAYDSETVSDLAEEVGGYAVDSDWRMALDGGARHAKVTAAKIRECVARLLNPERRVVGISKPATDPNRLERSR